VLRHVGFVFTAKNGAPWDGGLVLQGHLHLKVTDGHLHMFRHTFATRQLHAGVPVTVVSKFSTILNICACMAEHMEQFDFSVPEFWALIGHLKHLKWVRLQKNGKSRSIYDAGWSSLVARRAHNPEVVGSNPTPATSYLMQLQGLPIFQSEALFLLLRLS
jgi:hypothetical protein